MYKGLKILKVLKLLTIFNFPQGSNFLLLKMRSPLVIASALINCRGEFRAVNSCKYLFKSHMHFLYGLYVYVFFQALCHTTVFVFQIEFVKGQRPFLMPKTWRNQHGDLQCAVSPPVGPGQRRGKGLRGEAPWRSAYLGFENLLF